MMVKCRIRDRLIANDIVAYPGEGVHHCNCTTNGMVFNQPECRVIGFNIDRTFIVI